MPSKTPGTARGSARKTAAKGAVKTATQAVQVAAHAVGADKLLPFTDTMRRQVLLDKLSEFLMVEQGGLALYTLAAERSTRPALRERYEEFGRETAMHREVLVTLIERLGGDPSHVSPTARLAQVKASTLLEASIIVDGLSQDEIELNDLENVVLAETKDHADWSLLKQLGEQLEDGDVKTALQEVVNAVEEEEDTHLQWARDTHAAECLKLLMAGPAPLPTRLVDVTTGPVPPLQQIHPAPMRDQDRLLEGTQLPVWTDTPAVLGVRAAQAANTAA